ncbi:uncharacterized protein LOC111327829 [Stylophora pistillata]|uniref:uncharacterized protein LOC111327829 n=1 Tax=Stylophora pistillata TaxID=50429 RepID=UPI000C05071C|nr:uncharacterized protein LOC111327829 [Stylophora pistillata]
MRIEVRRTYPTVETLVTRAVIVRKRSDRSSNPSDEGLVERMITTFGGCARLIFCAMFAAACLYSASEGAATCFTCDSRNDKTCAPESLDKSKQTRCRSGELTCAVIKIEPYSPDGNTSNHQFVRFCKSECENVTLTLTVKTKHCTLCCQTDLCNDFSFDPCNPPSKTAHLGHGTLVTALLCGLAVLGTIYFR